MLPPHYSPLAHGASGGASAGLSSFPGGGDAGGGWVAVLGGHTGGAGSRTGTQENTTATAGIRAHPPAFELQPSGSTGQLEPRLGLIRPMERAIELCHRASARPAYQRTTIGQRDPTSEGQLAEEAATN